MGVKLKQARLVAILLLPQLKWSIQFNCSTQINSTQLARLNPIQLKGSAHGGKSPSGLTPILIVTGAADRR